jgi:hypothetical protein
VLGGFGEAGVGLVQRLALKMQLLRALIRYSLIEGGQMLHNAHSQVLIDESQIIRD